MVSASPPLTCGHSFHIDPSYNPDEEITETSTETSDIAAYPLTCGHSFHIDPSYNPDEENIQECHGYSAQNRFIGDYKQHQAGYGAAATPEPFSHTGTKGLGKGVGRTGDQMNVSTQGARDGARELAGQATR